MTQEPANADSSTLRRRMIDEQIVARGIADARILDAMRSVPRERFVPHELRHAAYDDRALSIAAGQTISQPFIVAHMTEQLDLDPHCRVLEVGTGSGYQCAILAALAAKVYSIERIDRLRESAERTLAELGIANVVLLGGDGSLGRPEFAPFDRIIVTAAAPDVPAPLIDQLADPGRLVIPVGSPTEQIITIVTREGRRIDRRTTIGCRFVKLIGQQAWHADESPTTKDASSWP